MYNLSEIAIYKKTTMTFFKKPDLKIILIFQETKSLEKIKCFGTDPI